SPIRRLAFPGLSQRNSCQLCFEVFEPFRLMHPAMTDSWSIWAERSRSCGEKVRLGQVLRRPIETTPFHRTWLSSTTETVIVCLDSKDTMKRRHVIFGVIGLSANTYTQPS